MTIHPVRTVHAAQLRQRRAATKLIALAALFVLGPIGAALAQKAEGPPGSAQNQPTAPSSTGAVGDTTVSRFVAVRVDTGGPGALSEAFSRPMSVRTDTLPAFSYTEAIGRPLTVRIDTTAAPPGLEVYSRPFAVRSDTLTAPFSFAEAITRQLSVLTDTSSTSALITEAYSRPFTVRSDTLTAPFSFAEANGRLFAVRSDTLATSFAHAQAFTRQLSVLATTFVPVAASCATNSISFHWASIPSFNYYRVYIATAPTDAAVIDSISAGADTTAIYSTGLLDGVRYYARVAGSTNGGASFDPFSVFNSGTLIDRTSPSASVPVLALTQPTSNMLQVGLSGNDPGTPLSFRLQVATDVAFAVTAVDTLLPGGIQEATLTVSRGSTFYARCMATDCAGNESVWSAASGGIFVANLPDLAVIAVTAAPSGTSASTVGLSWQIQNLGTGGTTVSSWIERVYLSPDSLLSQLTPLGDFPSLSYLLGGESYGRSATVTLPRGISGNYYLVVLVDATGAQAETNEANNRTKSPTPTAITLQNYADLRVTNVGAGDFAISGDSVSVVWTVKNVGTQPTEVPVWLDRVFISPDSALVYAFSGHFENVIFVVATHIGALSHQGVLGPNEQYTVSGRFKIPYPMAPGSYYVAVATDWGYSNDTGALQGNTYTAVTFDGNIYEYTEELANWRSDATNISLPPTPDLVVTAVQPPAQVTAGQLANVTWTVNNIGGGDPPEASWFDRIYISTSPQFNAQNATSLGDFLQLANPLPNPSSPADTAHLTSGIFPYSKNAQVRIPNGYQGTHYFHLITDVQDGVFENGADSNNVRTSLSFNVTRPPSPDLRIDFVTSTTTGQAGDSTTVIFQVTNAGSAIASSTSWTDQILIVRLDQNNAPIPGSDRILKNLSRTQALATGATYQPVERVLLPADLAAGTYAMKVQVDQTDVIYENVPEATNSALGQAVILEAYPSVDLVAEQVVTSSSAIAGDSLTVSWRIRNAGAANTLAGWWTDGIYLSADNQLDAGDQKLAVVGKAVVAPLGPNESYTVTKRVRTPRYWTTNAFLLIKADEGGVVAETSESNNVGHSNPIAFQLPVAVDLRVDSLSAPPTLIAGQPAQITITVSNHGPGSIPSSSWYDDLYLSSKPFIDGSALRLKQRRGSRPLAAGASYTDTAQVHIPNYVSGGQFLIARVDALDEINEIGREGNNSTIGTVSVAGQPLTDLSVSGITLADSVLAGDNILVSWLLLNGGPGTVNGSLQQGVFLSADGSWDVNDQLLGILTNSYTISPGLAAGRDVSLAISRSLLSNAFSEITRAVPGVLPNNYKILVRADLRDAFRETNESNNTASSVTGVEVSVRQVSINLPAIEPVVGYSTRYYSVALPSNGDWKVTASIPEGQGTVSLLWSQSAVPSPSNFDIASPTNESISTITVPEVGPLTAYVSVETRIAPEHINPLPLTVLIENLPLAIQAAAPRTVGNGDRVTITLHGSQFADDVTVSLRNSITQHSHMPFRILRRSSVDLRATWDLTAADLGLYDLVVKSRGDSATSLGAITIEPATGYVLSDETRVPDTIRNNSATIVAYRYKNTGNVDIPFMMMSDMIPATTTVVNAESSAGVLLTGNYRLNARTMTNEGLASQFTLDFDPTGAFQSSILQAVFYDIAPEEARTITAVLRAPSGDHFSGSRLTRAVSYETYLSSATIVADLMREQILQVPELFDPATVAIAADSVAFWRRYVDVVWTRQDSAKAGELKAGSIGGATELQHTIRVVHSSRLGPALALPEALTSTRPSASAGAIDACVRCPFLTHEGTCSWSELLAPYPCLCTNEGYSQASCWRRLNYLCAGVGLGVTPIVLIPIAGKYLLPLVEVGIGVTCANLQVTEDNGEQYCPSANDAWCYCRPILYSCDPNQLIGPAGAGKQAWISHQGRQSYSVLFENDSTLASTAARRVRVSLTLPTEIDLRSVKLRAFGFNNREFQVSGDRSFYSSRVSVGDTAGTQVDVVASVDPQTRVLRWIFDTIDPATGQEPSDPRAGFLPVNDASGAGTGHVDFDLELASGVSTRTVLEVGADIVFDTNPSLATNRTRNTIDVESPSSRVSPLPELAGEGSVDVWWTAEDDSAGSEVASVSLYSAKDGGMFGLVAGGLSTPPFRFEGEIGHEYSFYSVARDTAGNSEGAKNVAEATVRLTGSPIVWPGDTNNDTFVDEFDVLPLGRFFDTQGPARDSVSVRWVPREATGWVTPKAVFADANGDGRVNQNDLLAVGLNFGKRRTAVASTRPPEHIAEISLGGFAAGTTIELQVDLDATQAADVMGGAALQLVYPPEYLEPESVKALAADADNVIRLLKTDVRGGRCSIGLAGQGKAAQLLIGRDGHLTLTLAFRTKAAPAKGATVSIERCEALVGDVVTRDVNVSLSSDFAVDRPGVVRLLQNTPNPFATRTVFQFELPKAGEVSLQVFDVAGRLVAAPINRTRMTAGIHQVGLDGSDWASGIYFTELHIGSDVRTRKMLVLR